jgi:hypothetical protein
MHWRIPDQFQHLFDLGFHSAGHVRAAAFPTPLNVSALISKDRALNRTSRGKILLE